MTAVQTEVIEQLTTAASHEIRDPLRVALAELEKIIESPALHHVRQAQEHIGCALRRTEIMRNYGWLALDEESKDRMELDAALAGAVQNCQALITSTGARIDTVSLPAIHGNIRQWVQLFEHLIRNAIHYNDSMPPHISLQVSTSSSGHTLVMRDNGIGMEPEYTGLVFGLFHRLDTENLMDVVEGDGCGLALCRVIVQNHGGTITLLSQPDEYTEVHIRLPILL